jgi:lipid-A-disaccharide synthase
MGGPQMAEAGVRLVQDAGEVAVVGIQEVLAHLPAIRKAMRVLEGVLVDERPDLLVPIDFPDFNLRLSARARRADVDVVYFVSPQVWAWRRRRVHRIRQLVRRMLVLFPFETAFYEEAGVPVTFVGHPLAEQGSAPRSREELCAAAGLDAGREIIALVPGSRRSEVERLLRPMLEAARRVRERRPWTQTLVTLAPGLSREWFERELGQDDVRLHEGDFPEILSVCQAGAVASGTASLEAAVTGLPMVVVYRMGAVSHLIGRALVKLPHIAMPNLVAGRGVVPELIQGECNPERIAEELLRYLEDSDHAQRVRAELKEIRSLLGGPGVYDRAAEQILAELDRSP